MRLQETLGPEVFMALILGLIALILIPHLPSDSARGHLEKATTNTNRMFEQTTAH